MKIKHKTVFTKIIFFFNKIKKKNLILINMSHLLTIVRAQH
jgi:hypothetical protein